MKIKNLLKKRVLGTIPLFALIAIIAGGGIASAALLNYYGTITGAATVSQSVLVDGESVPGSKDISYSYDGPAGETLIEGLHDMENTADTSATVDIATTCDATETNCNGITRKAVEYFDDAGAEDTGANLSAYEAPETCNVPVDSITDLESAAQNDDNSGKTICVELGTYDVTDLGDSTLNITVDVTLASKVKPTSSTPATIDVSGENAPGIKVDASDVTIKGFKIVGISNDGTKTTKGLSTIKATSDADNLQIKSNNFVSVDEKKSNEALLLPEDTDNVQFINNMVDGYVQGIDAKGNVDNLLVKDNTFNMKYLQCDSCDANGDENETNDVKVTGRAVQLWWGNGVEIVGNDFNGAGKLSNLADNDKNMLNAYAYADFITYFGEEGNVTVENNDISNFYLGFGFFATGGEVTGNTIHDNLWGLQLGQESEDFASTGTTGLDISKNIIKDNKLGIFAQNIVLDGIGAHQNNIVGNSKYDVKNIDSDTFDATSNWWGTDGISTSENVTASWKSKEGQTTLNSEEKDEFGILVGFPIDTYPDTYTITTNIVPE